MKKPPPKKRSPLRAKKTPAKRAPAKPDTFPRPPLGAIEEGACANMGPSGPGGLCPAISGDPHGDLGYACSLRPHDGPHVASDGRRILAVWEGPAEKRVKAKPGAVPPPPPPAEEASRRTQPKRRAPDPVP